jgi:hypothetical protein
MYVCVACNCCFIVTDLICRHCPKPASFLWCAVLLRLARCDWKCLARLHLYRTSRRLLRHHLVFLSAIEVCCTYFVDGGINNLAPVTERFTAVFVVDSMYLLLNAFLKGLKNHNVSKAESYFVFSSVHRISHSGCLPLLPEDEGRSSLRNVVIF